MVYESEEAGTNRANVLMWSCGNKIDAIVADLKAKGVSFEYYSRIDGMRPEGNIHDAGTMNMVWFKDRDGNILHLNDM